MDQFYQSQLMRLFRSDEPVEVPGATSRTGAERGSRVPLFSGFPAVYLPRMAETDPETRYTMGDHGYIATPGLTKKK